MSLAAEMLMLYLDIFLRVGFLTPKTIKETLMDAIFQND